MSEVIGAVLDGAATMASTVNRIEENKRPDPPKQDEWGGGWGTETNGQGQSFDVAATMLGSQEPPKQPPKPQPEVVTGPISSGAEPPKRKYTRRSKTPPAPPSPAEQLRQLVNDSKFGMIMVACEKKMFEACGAPEMSQDEAVAIEKSTNALLVHLMKDSPNAQESVPFIAFAAAVGAPALIRAQPIYNATKGFWDAVGETVGNGVKWVVEKFKRKPPMQVVK